MRHAPQYRGAQWSQLLAINSIRAVARGRGPGWVLHRKIEVGPCSILRRNRRNTASGSCIQSTHRRSTAYSGRGRRVKITVAGGGERRRVNSSDGSGICRRT